MIYRMQAFASKLFESIYNLGAWIPTPQPTAPSLDEIAERDERTDIQQDDPQAITEQSNPKKLSAAGPSSRSRMTQMADAMGFCLAGETRQHFYLAALS